MGLLRIEQYEVDKYRVTGSFPLKSRKRKTVNVDGEQYHQDYIETKDVCATTLSLYKVELDELECFGFKPTILEHSFAYNKLFKNEAEHDCGYTLSTNEYVAYWEWLDYTKRLPYYVNRVWSGKSEWFAVENQKLKPHCMVKLLDYGFNNSLYADINWRMILTRKDKKSIPCHKSIAKLLNRHKIDLYKLTDKNITLNTIKLLNKIISQ